MKKFPFVSIIFPNYNGGNNPIECISSIKNINYPKEKLEVIVVDNGSTDRSVEKIKDSCEAKSDLANAGSRFARQISNIKYNDWKIKIIENKENVGFAKAVNQGIKQSNGKYVFIANDDIIFGKDSLKILVEYLFTHPKTGILGGKIFSKEKPTQVISCGYMMNKWTGNVYPSPNYNIIHEPDWIQGCAMLVPKVVLNKIGMLDQNFSLIYFEDFDFCLRAKKAGYNIAYLPTAYFWHGQSKTMDKDLPHKYYQWYKNKIRFIVKNLPLFNIISILMLQFFIIAPYRMIVLRDQRLFPFLKGFFWNIKNIQKTLAARTAL